MSKLDNKNVSKHLGKTSKYKSEYDDKLLVESLDLAIVNILKSKIKIYRL